MKPIVVVSAFDGMSCGQLALQRAGISVKLYFALEIDKYAIAVAKHNFPNTVCMGDITKMKYELPPVDLLIGGSPCQGFSFAGKQLNFKDPRSKLFFEFVRLLKEHKPKYFLLENVRMKQEYQDIISSYLGVEPILINSSLVSAQNRKRLYWTNIPNVGQPEDKGILLRDIIQDSDTFTDREKSHTITASMSRTTKKDYLEKSRNQMVLTNVHPSGRGQNGNVYSIDGKSPTLTTNKGEGPKVEERNMQTPLDDEVTLNEHQLEKINSLNVSVDKSNCLTGAVGRGGSSSEYLSNVKKKSLLLDEQKTSECIQVGIAADINGHDSIKRVYSPDGKSPCLNACTGGNREPKIQVVDGKLRVPEATKKGYVDIAPGEGVDLNFLNSDKRRGRRMSDKFHTITANNHSQRIVELVHPASIVGRRLNDHGVRKDSDRNVPMTQCLQVKKDDQKMGCITTVEKDTIITPEPPGRYPDVYNNPTLRWRKLTPIECERLQTLPDNYTLAYINGKPVSNSQRYKMLGNGWTVDVIAHIFSYLKEVLE